MSTNQESRAETPAEAAAAWWASALRDPKLDNGEDNPMLDVLVAVARQTRSEPAAEAIDQFKANLIEKLNELLDGLAPYDARHFGVDFGVDYSPDDVLWECAEKAGISAGMIDWPWKTTMWVKPQEVSVSCGYGRPIEVIWAREPS